MGYLGWLTWPRHLESSLPHQKSAFPLVSFLHTQLPACALQSPLVERCLYSSVDGLSWCKGVILWKVLRPFPVSRVGGEACWQQRRQKAMLSPGGQWWRGGLLDQLLEGRRSLGQSAGGAVAWSRTPGASAVSSVAGTRWPCSIQASPRRENSHPAKAVSSGPPHYQCCCWK